MKVFCSAVTCPEELELRCCTRSISHRRSWREQGPSTHIGAACVHLVRACGPPAGRQRGHTQLPSPGPAGWLSRLPATAGVQPGACASADGRRRRPRAWRRAPRGARHGRGASGRALRRRTGGCGPAAGSRLPGAAPAALHRLLLPMPFALPACPAPRRAACLAPSRRPITACLNALARLHTKVS